MQALWTVLSLTACISAATTAPSCKSATGQDVDFAYSFKYPQGWDYAYMDSHHPLAKAPGTLASSSSSVSSTILQKHGSGVSVLMWNDDPPYKSSTSAPRAHSKGLLLFTSEGGAWLTHSLPEFPVANASTASGLYAEASEIYAQSYLCVTVSAEEIHKLAPLFKITRPTFYEAKFGSGEESTFADLKAVSDGGNWDSETMTTDVTISSKGGQEFHVYAKAGAWGTGKDLYRDLVAPSIGKLSMEGWRHGAGVWGPACGKDEVLDVTAVSFPGQDWSTMSDHSKWAVSQTGSAFCIGDLNRADGQDKRGGKTVCIETAHSLRNSFSSQMRKVIDTTDKCSHDAVIV